MDKEQDQRFREAVERKKREADAAARATQDHPPGTDSPVQGDQASLRDPSQPQATFSPRDKNSRHKQVTADKWNQQAANPTAGRSGSAGPRRGYARRRRATPCRARRPARR